MASFEQNKSSQLWSVRFRVVEDGITKNKRLSGFKTKREANAAYIDFMNSYVPQVKYDSNVSYIYDDLLKKYLYNNGLETKESTQYDKKGVFNNFVTPYFKGTDVRSYNKIKLFEWQTALWQTTRPNGKPYSYKYLTKIRGFFFSFLAWIQETYDVPNALKSVKLPKSTEPKKEMNFWEHSEFDTFISVVDDIRFSALFNFLFYTGCRIGEAQALTESDLNNGTVHICKNIIKKTVDGSLYKISATKNYKNRKVRLPKVLHSKLEEFLQWKRAHNLESDFLFGDKLFYSDSTIHRYFINYISIAGVKPIRIHDLRHSYVSLLVHLGKSTKVIAALIGDTEEQVIKTYSHLYSQDTAKAVDEIDVFLQNRT